MVSAEAAPAAIAGLCPSAKSNGSPASRSTPPMTPWFGLRADYGVPGLLAAMTLSLAFVALALGFRFWVTVRRDVRPI